MFLIDSNKLMDAFNAVTSTLLNLSMDMKLLGSNDINNNDPQLKTIHTAEEKKDSKEV